MHPGLRIPARLPSGSWPGQEIQEGLDLWRAKAVFDGPRPVGVKKIRVKGNAERVGIFLRVAHGAEAVVGKRHVDDRTAVAQRPQPGPGQCDGSDEPYAPPARVFAGCAKIEVGDGAFEALVPQLLFE